MKNQIILVSLSFILSSIVIFSCESSKGEKDKVIMDNTIFAINQVQTLTRSELGRTMENYRFYVGKPELEDKISKTVLDLLKYSDILQAHIIDRTWDCSLIVREIIESYDLIENQFNTTIDSVRVAAKLSTEEAEKWKVKFKKGFGLNIQNLDACKSDSNQEYLISELLRLNVSINKLIYDISTFTPWGKPTYERIPIVVPDKPYDKAGETFSSDIYVGNFLLPGDTKEIVEVNGKEYSLIENKIQFQEKVPNKKGSRELNVIYKKENLYSKEIETIRKIVYTYDIK